MSSNMNYNYSDHYSSDELSPEKTAPMKENGSSDDGSSDENTVATGSSGSVPSDQSFFEDNEVFIRNKETLRKKLNDRIETYESFFEMYFGRMQHSVRTLKSLTIPASSLMKKWKAQWENDIKDYCAQVSEMDRAKTISLDMYNTIITLEKRIERSFIHYMNSLKQLLRIDRALFLYSTMKESSKELADALKELLLSTLNITQIEGDEESIIFNLFHSAYPSLKTPTLSETYLNADEARRYDDQFKKDWEKVQESLDNTVEKTCCKRSKAVKKFRTFLKRVLESDSDNLDYLRNMFQHKVQRMYEEAVEAYDELCRNRNNVLKKEDALVELVGDGGTTRIRSTISMELCMEEKKVIWLLNNTPKYHSKDFASSEDAIEQQFNAYLQMYNRIMEQIAGVTADLRTMIRQNKYDREKEEDERERKALEDEAQKRKKKYYTKNTQTVMIASWSIAILIAIMLFLVYGDSQPQLFSFATKVADSIKALYDMIPW